MNDEVRAEQKRWDDAEKLVVVQACDGTCRDNPFCPEHGMITPFDGQDEQRCFLLINGIPVGELADFRDNFGVLSLIQRPANADRAEASLLTLQDGDYVAIQHFQGPHVDYSTWQEAA